MWSMVALDGMTMKCNHENSVLCHSYKDIAGLRFEYDTRECNDCNKTLWNSQHETQFHDWLNEQKRSQRDRFTVQKVQILNDLSQFAEELARKHHRSESNVYQACLALYFVWGRNNQDSIRYLDNLSVPEGEATLKRFRINPGMFVRLDANAKLFDMHMNEIASWVIQRVLIAVKVGAQRNDYELLSKIEFALEAA